MFWGASIAEISTAKTNACLINFSEAISYHKCDKIIDISVGILLFCNFLWMHTVNNSVTLILYHHNELDGDNCTI